MADRHHHLLLLQQQQQLQQQSSTPVPPPPRSRFGRATTGGGGEIVEVQGGHIVRSTGRKDRHSKVCTAKGPRDRRVRLSAHTAIQFYDVQDRLGYDRPSKAVDWLIKNAKSAIDELAELPPWHPTADPTNKNSISAAASEPGSSASPYGFGGGSGGGGGGNSSSFLPPSLASDEIADTIKSFFPMAAAAPASPPIHYQNYPPDLLSRTSSQNQDLRLSLHSFQDPIFHHPNHHPSASAAASHQHHTIFDAAAMVPWNVGESSGGGGGYVFNLQTPQAVSMHPVLGQSQFFTQRGPLQSSNPPFVRAWVDPMAAAAAVEQQHPMHAVLHPSVQAMGFASGGGGFSGFRIPARIQGEEEEHDGISDKPSSASSGSHH